MYYIVYLITIVTIQSTTGYFNLIAFVIAVLISRRDKIPSYVKKIIMIAIAAFAIYMIFGYSEDSFLYRNFFMKILSDSGDVDLAATTGAARTDPMERFGDTIRTVPYKLILGVGYEGLRNLPLGGYTTCGLINCIAMIGSFSSIILYGKLIISSIKVSKSIIQIALVLFLVINMGLSQPDLLSIMTVLICMYGIYSKNIV